MLSLQFWGLTFDFLGKFLLVATALLVHRRIKIEGKIDKLVLKRMKLEQVVAYLGFILLILGYLMEASILI